MSVVGGLVTAPILAKPALPRPGSRADEPRGPRSGADIGREVLAGEGGAGGDEVGGRALEDDPAAVVAGAGAKLLCRGPQRIDGNVPASRFQSAHRLQDSPRHNYDNRAKRDSSPRTHLSQSEHDWAFAKRGLARGDDPEQIIRQIAQHRATDKTNPEYYARHTVEKAMAELKVPPARPRTSPHADSENNREPGH